MRRAPAPPYHTQSMQPLSLPVPCLLPSPPIRPCFLPPSQEQQEMRRAHSQTGDQLRSMLTFSQAMIHLMNFTTEEVRGQGGGVEQGGWEIHNAL